MLVFIRSDQFKTKLIAFFVSPLLSSVALTRIFVALQFGIDLDSVFVFKNFVLIYFGLSSLRRYLKVTNETLLFSAILP